LEDTVLRLRELKGREAKPFAIMFESVDSIRKYCVVSEKEEELLKSKARPIVLLYLKTTPWHLPPVRAAYTAELFCPILLCTCCLSKGADL